jgi:hypothetical protein
MANFLIQHGNDYGYGRLLLLYKTVYD